MSGSKTSELAFIEHDHGVCMEAAMAACERVCAARGARLTPIRRRVLEILWETHRPLGAYGILDRLRAEGRSAQPPTVYRTLEFLTEHGLAHRLSTLNAFIGCRHPETPHAPHFLICTSCEGVGEVASGALEQAVAAATEASGFVASTAALEIAGRCARCAALEPK